MRLRFREDRATQTAAKLLDLGGGRMNHMKLIKLVYLADRKALLEYGRPITFDYYYSLDHGPVPSLTLDKVTSQRNPRRPSYWHQYISERTEHEVCLVAEAHVDQLSPAEEEIIESVFADFGHMSQWDLEDYCHTLPEWQDPKGSRLPIEIRNILLSEGWSKEAVRDVEDTLQGQLEAVNLMG